MEPMRRQPAATTRPVHVKVSIDQLPAAQGRTGAGGRKAVGLQGRWGCKGAGGAMALGRRSCRFWRLVTSTRTAAKSTAQPRTSSKREQPARQISAVDLARAGCDHKAPVAGPIGHELTGPDRQTRRSRSRAAADGRISAVAVSRKPGRRADRARRNAHRGISNGLAVRVRERGF
jgi:hypothetical protein